MFLRSEEAAPAAGAAVPIDVMWHLTRAWYGDRLQPDYRPKSPAAHQAMLTDAGLTGEFWRLG